MVLSLVFCEKSRLKLFDSVKYPKNKNEIPAEQFPDNHSETYIKLKYRTLIQILRISSSKNLIPF